MQRKLSELEGEQLVFVWETNYKLQEKVRSDFEQYITDDIYEYIITLKSGLLDWSIGFCGHNYIVPKYNNDFIDAFEQLQTEYCFLYDADDEYKYDGIIINLRHKMNLILDANDDEYETLENEIDKTIKMLSNEILAKFERELNYDEEELLDYFFNDWLEYNEDDNYFINENYELFQTKTKSFK